MSVLRFVAYPFDDISGTALGELVDIWDKHVEVQHDGLGGGGFQINRHADSSPSTLARLDTFVRVFIAADFDVALDIDDAVAGFFIETGQEDIVSADENGGEDYTREGRGPLSIFDRGVLSDEASSAITATIDNETEGKWTWAAGTTVGQVMLDILDDATARGVFATYGVTISTDFDETNDSDGDAWDAIDEEFVLPIGMTVLEAMGILRGQETVFKMGPDFVLHAHQDWSPPDSTAVTFENGVNIEEAGERTLQGAQTKSRMLVQGTTKDGALKYRWVTNSTIETERGRREGFLSYGATPANSALDRAGRNAMSLLRQRSIGPGSIQVETNQYVPFDDYHPGDEVTLNIDGVFDDVAKMIDSITLVALDGAEVSIDPGAPVDASDPRANGDGYDAILGFDGPGFDQLGASLSTTGDAPTDTPGGGHTCGDCPPGVPFVPSSGCTPNFSSNVITGATITDVGGAVTFTSTANANDGDIDTVAEAGPTTGTYGDSAGLVIHLTAARKMARFVIREGENGNTLWFSDRDTGMPDHQWPEDGEGRYVGWSDDGSSWTLIPFTFTRFPDPEDTANAISYYDVTDPNGIGAHAWWLIGHDETRGGLSFIQFTGIGELYGYECVATTSMPGEGQTIPNEVHTVGDGVVVSGGQSDVILDFDYIPGSLEVTVDNIPVLASHVVEDDPTAGTFHLDWEIDDDETVRVTYQKGFD